MQMLLKSFLHIDCRQARRVPGITAVVDSKHDFPGVEARMPRTGDSPGGRAPRPPNGGWCCGRHGPQRGSCPGSVDDEIETLRHPTVCQIYAILIDGRFMTL